MIVIFRKTLLLVDHLCDDVENGRTIGNLCKEICSGALDSYTCQALHGGKEVVFSAQFHANPVYVKGNNNFFLGGGIYIIKYFGKSCSLWHL